MVRAAGVVLLFLASASIALGSPLCCLLGTGCCGAKTTAATSDAKPDCCPHCKRDEPGKPAPKPCPQEEGCMCEHDVANHAAAAEHAPFVAMYDVPALALPARAVDGVATKAHRALPLSPARTTHPLLL